MGSASIAAASISAASPRKAAWKPSTSAAAGAAGSDLDSVARIIATGMDDNRELHLARLELELAAARDP